MSNAGDLRKLHRLQELALAVEEALPSIRQQRSGKLVDMADDNLQALLAPRRPFPWSPLASLRVEGALK